jgi:hypothetical protein
LSAITVSLGLPVSRSASGSYSFSVGGNERVAERNTPRITDEDEPDTPDEAVL